MTLIENWAKQLTRAWSIRLAAFAGIVAGYLAMNPDQTKELLALLPEGPWRVLASIGIGLLVFALPTAARLTRQGKPPENPQGE